MATKIQFRRATAAEWAGANPQLSQGEAGYEYDTGKFKVGNGTSLWNSLPYSSGVTGPTGATGATGATGPTGAMGPTGDTNIHPAVSVIQATNTSGTYFVGTTGADGGNGVGAYIQSNANAAIGSIDGRALILGDRILYIGNTDAKTNGIYQVTALGSAGGDGGSRWRVTRTSDADNSVAGEVAPGDYVFVNYGTVYANKAFMLNSNGTGTNGSIKIGTDNISWTQVGAAGTTGPTGPTGATGATGPTGAASTVTGPTGPTGAAGSASYYGYFLSTATQTSGGVTTANQITLNTTVRSSGATLATNAITIANSGTYKIKVNASYNKTTANSGTDNITFWYTISGTNSTYSSVASNYHTSDIAVSGIDVIESLTAGQVLRFFWTSAEVTMQLVATAAGTNPTRPAAPSVNVLIFNI